MKYVQWTLEFTGRMTILMITLTYYHRSGMPINWLIPTLIWLWVAIPLYWIFSEVWDIAKYVFKKKEYKVGVKHWEEPTLKGDKR